MQKKISVIIPVYNTAQYIEKCVCSILEQTYSNLEVLLINDGSTDESGKICDTFAQSDARVTVFHQRKEGTSSARNTGMEHATGDYYSFIDSDDWIDPTMYEDMIAALEQSNAEVCGSAFRFVFSDHIIDEAVSNERKIFTRQQALTLLPKEKEMRFETCCKVYRKSVIGSIRYIKGKAFEDAYFNHAVFDNVKTYVYIDHAYYNYLQNRKGNTNSSFKKEKTEVLDEFNSFAKHLRSESLNDAGDGVAAFGLKFNILLYLSARRLGAETDILKTLIKKYRATYWMEKGNIYVPKLRSLFFYLTPHLYFYISSIKNK